MTDIEQLVELKPDKTYYLRVSSDASDSDIIDFNDNIHSLNLGCTIIVGRGEFDIEEVMRVVGADWGNIL